MAYAYGAIDDLMGQPQKQNIFGQQPAQGANPNPNDVTSGQAVKTSTEGEIGATAPGSTATATTPKVQETSGVTAQNKNTQAAYKANVGKTKAPDTLNSMQARIGEAQSGLEKQAQDYAAQQAAKHNYAVDTSVADKAVKEQDQAAKGSILGLMGRGIADPIDQFEAQGTDVKDVNLLNTPAGLKNLVSRGRSPTYGSNMAAFDSMLLQADPNFQRQVAGIKGQAGDLQRAVGTTTDRVETEAEAAAKANLAKSKDDISKYLLGYQGNITAAEALAAQQANDALPGEIEKIKGQVYGDLSTQEQRDAEDALRSTYGSTRANDQIKEALAQMDPSQYVDFLKSYSPEQFVSQDQATQFNTINQLLGLGGKPQVAAGDRPELYSTRSDDFYNSLVGKARDLREKKDVLGNASLKKILDAANQSAKASNELRLGQTNNYGSELQKQAQAILGSKDFANQTPEMRKRLMDSFNQDYVKLNPVAAMGTSANPNLTGMDLLNSSQVEQLNALSKDLGLNTSYNAGSYAGGAPAPIINQQKVKDFLMKVLGNIQNQPKLETQPGITGPSYIPTVIPDKKPVDIRTDDGGFFGSGMGY